MKRLYFIIVLIFLLGFNNFLFAQTNTSISDVWVKKLWKENIRNFVKPITSIDSVDFSDLMFSESLWKDKQYVFIGESSHEVSEYFLLRTRLIKFLHEKLGYNILAFEYNMGLCSYFNEIKIKLPIKEQQPYIFYDDGKCEETVDLINYIDSTDLTISGFDIQLAEQPLYYSMIRNQFKNFPENLIKEDSLHFFSYDGLGGSIKKDSLNRNGEKVIMANRSKNKDSLVAKWEKVLKDSAIFNQKDKISLLLKKSIQSRTTWIKLMPAISPEQRDSVMAADFLWIIKNIYPNEKIIIWAHNEHIAKNNVSFHNMGSLLPDSIRKKSYVLGLYAYQGTTGVRGPIVKLVKNKRNSLGAIINSANYEISFCDFSLQTKGKENSWMFEKMKTISWAFQRPEIIPVEYYDGIIQIKNIHPQNQIK